MKHLSKEFWSSRYENNQTGWDLGTVSPPIKAYFDQVEDKTVKILIPGCGNGHEAEYLHKSGFKNVNVIDLVAQPLDNLLKRNSDFPKEHVHVGDFFEHEGKYDYIIEQTLFCAINPAFREKYAENARRLLKKGGKLVGLLFDTEFESGPPYGGCKQEYLTYFEKYFPHVTMESCYNSIPPRMGKELFIQIS